jgi:LmbE family N-acetylglucosaminyl deacetylase
VNYETILVFGAHPDDEISMGGTMAKLSRQGTEVVVVTMTDGCEGYPREEMREKVVAMRQQEMAACDEVLGISRRIALGKPDMGLVNDKETLQECIGIIRDVRPDALFTHGPHEHHRDHANTHAIAIEAQWHAGEPVAAALGPSYRTPHVYYYKGVMDRRPSVAIDVSETEHLKSLARGTQVSQHTLWGRTREQFEQEAERIRAAGGRHMESFWFAERTVLYDFPARGL